MEDEIEQIDALTPIVEAIEDEILKNKLQKNIKQKKENLQRLIELKNIIDTDERRRQRKIADVETFRGEFPETSATLEALGQLHNKSRNQLLRSKKILELPLTTKQHKLLLDDDDD